MSTGLVFERLGKISPTTTRQYQKRFSFDDNTATVHIGLVNPRNKCSMTMPAQKNLVCATSVPILEKSTSSSLSTDSSPNSLDNPFYFQ
uniref:Uncharacterized protein n=1 Tax=viral metagenome TaxID=1070528 RepID=A0A6C0FCZ5_9ZZZZ